MVSPERSTEPGMYNPFMDPTLCNHLLKAGITYGQWDEKTGDLRISDEQMTALQLSMDLELASTMAKFQERLIVAATLPLADIHA